MEAKRRARYDGTDRAKGSMAAKWGGVKTRKSSFVYTYASSESESEEELTHYEAERAAEE